MPRAEAPQSKHSFLPVTETCCPKNPCNAPGTPLSWHFHKNRLASNVRIRDHLQSRKQAVGKGQEAQRKYKRENKRTSAQTLWALHLPVESLRTAKGAEGRLKFTYVIPFCSLTLPHRLLVWSEHVPYADIAGSMVLWMRQRRKPVPGA